MKKKPMPRLSTTELDVMVAHKTKRCTMCSEPLDAPKRRWWQKWKFPQCEDDDACFERWIKGTPLGVIYK